jgi:hypothetical protein
MSYELAKELKDAGFPKLQGYADGYVMMNDALWPTLSELIEACKLDRFVLQVSHGKWIAGEWPGNDLEPGGCRGKGSTPEEAVAKLWLTLHEKA